MTLPGGAADKVGMRYELAWTVVCIERVLSEEALSLRLEPPDRTGLEFTLSLPDGHEHYQVKHRSGVRPWSLADLVREGVIQAAYQSLSTSGERFHFVTDGNAAALGQLADRARVAIDADEFQKSLTEVMKPNLTRLSEEWEDWSDQEVWQGLTRSFVRTVDEVSVRWIAGSLVAPLIDADPLTAVAALESIILSSPGESLSAPLLWSKLERMSMRPRQWNHDPRVAGIVDEMGRRHIALSRDLAIAGEELRRAQTDAVMSCLDGDQFKVVIVSGEGGVGKSFVIRQALREMREDGRLVLPIRVDQLEPVASPVEVGRQLGLPGSPAAILAALAADGDGLLLLDQLDAVSTTSGRSPQFLSCIQELMSETLTHPRLRVMIACRQFDLDNDPRLRRLAEGPDVGLVQVGPLTDGELDVFLGALAMDPVGFSSDQRAILRVPLHLQLLSESADPAASRFGTSQDLFRFYWDAKERGLRERLGRAPAWADVIGMLSDEMSADQNLSVPIEWLDEHADTRDALLSEGVLTSELGRLSFFHEAFFDYAYARRFVARGAHLIDLLRSAEQQLFRRGQVRQILTYLRTADRGRYLRELQEILEADDVRFHIKELALSWIGRLPDPSTEEWQLLAGLIRNGTEPVVRHAKGAVRGSPAWFDRLQDDGSLADWFAGTDNEVNDAFMVCRFVCDDRGDQIAALLAPHIDKTDADWQRRWSYLVTGCHLSKSRTLFELVLALQSRGALDMVAGLGAVNGTFWDLTITLRERADWASEFIAAYLRRRLTIAIKESRDPFRDPDVLPDPVEHDLFRRTAKDASKEFAEAVVPVLVEFAAAAVGRWPEPFRVRSRGTAYGIEPQLLEGVEIALRSLATAREESLGALMAQLRSADFDFAGFLALRTWAANGSGYASAAAAYVLEEPGRLLPGYMDSSLWPARELLQAITPHVSDETFGRLEELVLGFSAPWEMEHRSQGAGQLVLLEGLDSSRLSAPATRRLGELRRRFPAPEPPRSLKAEFIGSPVPPSAVPHMTDENWRQAIAQYNRDDIRWDRPLKRAGGSHQLSSQLSEETAKTPERFLRLMESLPDDSDPVYFDAILRGLAQAESVIDEQLFRAARRAHEIPGAPCGRSVMWALRAVTGATWPSEILDMLEFYATEDPDPESDQWLVPAGSGQAYYGGDPLGAGINSVRGSAADAITHVLAHQPAALAVVLPALRHLAQDEVGEVRAVAAHSVLRVHGIDRSLGLELTKLLVEDAHERVLATPYFQRLLLVAAAELTSEVEELVRQLMESSDPEIAKSGARLATLVALVHEQEAGIMETLAGGTQPQRLGAAEILSANLSDPAVAVRVADRLAPLFHDSDLEVRREAANCFRGMSSEALRANESLIEIFVHSPAFDDGADALFYALEELTDELPGVARVACRQFLERAGTAAGDITTSAARIASEVSAIVFRLYSQARNPDDQRSALDLLDLLAAAREYGWTRGIQEFERG